MTDKSDKNKGGRPKLQLDREQIARLAELHCNKREIAFVMGCSVDTLDRHHKTDIERGQAQGKIKLRRAMFRNAVEKDQPVMQIWLSKNYLGMQDAPNSDDSDAILPWSIEQTDKSKLKDDTDKV
jgi:hypothetical protein